MTQLPTGRPRPIEGLKVLDLTTFLSGPYATQILADLGADVVKVEPPSGDSSRAIPPYFMGEDSAYFLSVNREKRSIVLDLKRAAGMDTLRRMATEADVLIENYRPGVLARLGLTYDGLAETNPGVVWCSISGFGQAGPYRDRPAYDMVVQALSGAMSMTGLPGGEAVRAGIPIGDLAAGMYGVIGILAALHERDTSGRGRQIDVAMLDCQISMLSYQGVYHLVGGASPGRQGRMHDSIPTYRGFTAGDGAEVIVTANTQGMWLTLCEVLGLRELAADPRFVDGRARQQHRDELGPLLEEVFRTDTAEAWLERLHVAGVPAAPVNEVSQALADPQVRLREMVVDVPDGTRGDLRLLGDPVKFSEARARVPAPPPRLGQHNEEVLEDWLGNAEPAPAAVGIRRVAR